MKKKFDVKGFLIINYLITFAILFVVLKLASVSTYFIVQKIIYKDQPLAYTNLASAYNKDFDKIKIEFMEKIGGWAEVIDENKKVIYIKGQKKDSIMQYTEQQLLELVSSSETYSVEKPYLGEIALVEGKNGETYTFLLKIDKRKISHKIVYDPSFYEKEDIAIALKIKGIGYLFICLYLLLGIYVYSRISSRFITKPLRGFVDGIKKMKELDYDTRVNIGEIKELKEVENEFNKMAKRLQEVEEEKKKTDESKKRLLVDISHDLKTPITSIQGFSKLVLEENITLEKQERYLNIIHDKAVYSALLIEDLFQLSKLEDSGYYLDLKENNFSEWLRCVIGEYYEEFRNKGFKLEINISEQPILFKFDAKLMKRAISNILSNSLKYNEAGTTVGISCCLENRVVRLKLSDDGKGIEEDIKKEIFEPFVKSKEKKSEGSGLGLAITQKIIDRHDGTIILSSNSKEKTLFDIYLPT